MNDWQDDSEFVAWSDESEPLPAVDLYKMSYSDIERGMWRAWKAGRSVESVRVVAITKERDDMEAALRHAQANLQIVGKASNRSELLLIARQERVAALEGYIRDGMPSNASAGEVPRDGKNYRVFIRPQSIVVAWERGPNVWNNRTPIDDPGWDSDADWYVCNSDGYLLEPDKEKRND